MIGLGNNAIDEDRRSANTPSDLRMVTIAIMDRHAKLTS
jgi:hypothetical protein